MAFFKYFRGDFSGKSLIGSGFWYGSSKGHRLRQELFLLRPCGNSAGNQCGSDGTGKKNPQTGMFPGKGSPAGGSIFQW